MNIIKKAAAAVAAAGFTPCAASSFETADRAFSFSVESVSGRAESGPAVTVEVFRATGDVFINNKQLTKRG